MTYVWSVSPLEFIYWIFLWFASFNSSFRPDPTSLTSNSSWLDFLLINSSQFHLPQLFFIQHIHLSSSLLYQSACLVAIDLVFQWTIGSSSDSAQLDSTGRISLLRCSTWSVSFSRSNLSNTPLVKLLWLEVSSYQRRDPSSFLSTGVLLIHLLHRMIVDQISTQCTPFLSRVPLDHLFPTLGCGLNLATFVVPFWSLTWVVNLSCDRQLTPHSPSTLSCRVSPGFT